MVSWIEVAIVFSVTCKARVEGGVLKVAYDKYGGKFAGKFGHIYYKDKFSHYILRVEYRFVGEQVPGGPGWALRNSGVMIHGQSAESMGKDQSFPVSIEVQLLGGTGSGNRTTGNLCTPGTNVVMNGRLHTQHCTNSTSKTYHGDQWVTVEVEVRGGLPRLQAVPFDAASGYSSLEQLFPTDDMLVQLRRPWEFDRGDPGYPNTHMTSIGSANLTPFATQWTVSVLCQLDLDLTSENSVLQSFYDDGASSTRRITPVGSGAPAAASVAITAGASGCSGSAAAGAGTCSAWVGICSVLAGRAPQGAPVGVGRLVQRGRAEDAPRGHPAPVPHRDASQVTQVLHLLQQHVHAPAEEREDQFFMRHESGVKTCHEALGVGVKVIDVLKSVHDRRDGLVLDLLRERVNILVMLVERGLVDHRRLAQALDPHLFQRIRRAQFNKSAADIVPRLDDSQIHAAPRKATLSEKSRLSNQPPGLMTGAPAPPAYNQP